MNAPISVVKPSELDRRWSRKLSLLCLPLIVNSLKLTAKPEAMLRLISKYSPVSTVVPGFQSESQNPLLSLIFVRFTGVLITADEIPEAEDVALTGKVAVNVLN